MIVIGITAAYAQGHKAKEDFEKTTAVGPDGVTFRILEMSHYNAQSANLFHLQQGDFESEYLRPRLRPYYKKKRKGL